MAHRQPGVPEQGEELRQAGTVRLLRVRFGQHQQVDVRAREQLAPAIAADGDQRQRRAFRDALVPGPAQQVVDQACAQGQQAVDVHLLAIALEQAGVAAQQQFAGAGGPLGVERAGGGAGRNAVHAGARAGRGHAGGGCWPAARVSTSTPSSVTATMCSHCAESLRSLVTTVQPSGSTLV